MAASIVGKYTRQKNKKSKNAVENTKNNQISELPHINHSLTH